MNRKPIRVIFYTPWTRGFTDAEAHLDSLKDRDLAEFVAESDGEDVKRKARIDRDWDAATLKAFARMQHSDVTFLPARVSNNQGLIQMIEHAQKSQESEESWLILSGTRPSRLEPIIEKVLKLFTLQGGKVLFWSWDQSSLRIRSFIEKVAPYLSFLIHDEITLPYSLVAALNPACRTLLHSPAANLCPFEYPFHENVEKKILFVGSELGLTDSRKKQIEALKAHFGERFMCKADFSVEVDARKTLGQYQVNWCPEGRFFADDNMSQSHTDRPFWAGCLGQVPVIENSKQGSRMQDYVDNGLTVRYEHGDSASLLKACEQALEASLSERRRIYDYYNSNETFGTIAAEAIATHQEPALQKVNKELVTQL